MTSLAGAEHLRADRGPQLLDLVGVLDLESKGRCADGNLEMTGSLPTNTHGGQLGEAYIHGVNGSAEGVRQIRGEAVNQAESAENVQVAAGTGVPTSSMILQPDR